jgi:hypothetical protein
MSLTPHSSVSNSRSSPREAGPHLSGPAEDRWGPRGGHRPVAASTSTSPHPRKEGSATQGSYGGIPPSMVRWWNPTVGA